METKYKHMTITQRNELIELFKKPEELLNGTLGT